MGSRAQDLYKRISGDLFDFDEDELMEFQDLIAAYGEDDDEPEDDEDE